MVLLDTKTNASDDTTNSKDNYNINDINSNTNNNAINVKWNDYVLPRVSHGSGDLLILIVPFMQKTMPVKGNNLAASFDDWHPDEATLLDIVLMWWYLLNKSLVLVWFSLERVAK